MNCPYDFNRKEVGHMINCCGTDCKDLKEKFSCDIRETKEGVVIEVKPKDPSKADSLKAMVKACKDIGCDC